MWKLKKWGIPADIGSEKKFEKLSDSYLSSRDRAIIAIFYEICARREKLLQVQPKNVNFDENEAILNNLKRNTGSCSFRFVLASSTLNSEMALLIIEY